MRAPPQDLLTFCGASAVQARAANAVAAHHVLRSVQGDLMIELHPGGHRVLLQVGGSGPPLARDSPQGRVLCTAYIDGPRLVQEDFVEAAGYTMASLFSSPLVRSISRIKL